MSDTERNDDREKRVRRRRNHRPRHREEDGESGSIRSTPSEHDSELGKIPIAASKKNKDEDVETINFDLSESHKSLREDPNYAEEKMQQNIFSLMYVAPISSAAFWFAFVMSLFQLALPFLALLDLIVLNDDDGNWLQIPKNVKPHVRILAGMVLILAVIQFWDLMEALEHLEKGPPPATSDIPKGATCW